MTAKILKFGPREPKASVLTISINAEGTSVSLPVMRSGRERRFFLAAIRLFHTELLDRAASLVDDSDELEQVVLYITVTPTGFATVSVGGKLTPASMKEALKELMQLAVCLAA